MYWFFTGKCSRVSVLITGPVKEPGFWCVVGAPVSCYGSLIETLYATTSNGNVWVRRLIKPQPHHTSSVTGSVPNSQPHHTSSVTGSVPNSQPHHTSSVTGSVPNSQPPSHQFCDRIGSNSQPPPHQFCDRIGAKLTTPTTPVPWPDRCQTYKDRPVTRFFTPTKNSQTQ